jgi:hypothetical protein
LTSRPHPSGARTHLILVLILAGCAVQPQDAVVVTCDTTQDKFGSYGIVRENCWRPLAKAGSLLFDHCQPA